MGTRVDALLDHWVGTGRQLTTSAGVHRPSAFSALLASAMDDCAGQVVVDAGCGAGLVSIAALAAGAAHVVAQDYDPACLADTAHNVTAVLGVQARQRLSLWQADWRQITPLTADVLAVNPPQRPSVLLPDVGEDVLHLHEGGGVDGLEAHRMVLGHAGAARVRVTAASVLGILEQTPDLCGQTWAEPSVAASAVLPLDPAWRRLRPELADTVDVWEFRRL